MLVRLANAVPALVQVRRPGGHATRRRRPVEGSVVPDAPRATRARGHVPTHPLDRFARGWHDACCTTKPVNTPCQCDKPCHPTSNQRASPPPKAKGPRPTVRAPLPVRTRLHTPARTRVHPPKYPGRSKRARVKLYIFPPYTCLFETSEFLLHSVTCVWYPNSSPLLDVRARLWYTPWDEYI